MITIKEYAKKHKISMRAARWQLEDKMSRGLMDRKRGPCNRFLYYKINVPNLRWHDPFNRCKRRMPIARKGEKWPMMPRQRQILEYYREGFTTKRIAEKMEISVHTLYTHLKRIYYKLEVHNIKDAIERGLR